MATVFNFSNGEISGITSSDTTDIVFPSTIDGENVTRIYINYDIILPTATSISVDNPNLQTLYFGDVLKNNTTLTTVSIGVGTSGEINNDGVGLDQYLFNNCSQLTTITISGGSAWGIANGCPKLSSVNLSNTTLKYKMSNGAFKNCNAITELLIPTTVELMNGAFSGCTGLTTITFEAGRSEPITFYDNEFAGCTGLTTINLNGNTISSRIQSSAFSESGLTSFPFDKLTSTEGIKAYEIGEMAFYSTSLTSIDLSKLSVNKTGLDYIKLMPFAFLDTQIKSLYLPELNNSVITTTNYSSDVLPTGCTIYVYESNYTAFKALSTLSGFDIQTYSGSPTIVYTPYYYNGKEWKSLIPEVPDTPTVVQPTYGRYRIEFAQVSSPTATPTYVDENIIMTLPFRDLELDHTTLVNYIVEHSYDSINITVDNINSLKNVLPKTEITYNKNLTKFDSNTNVAQLYLNLIFIIQSSIAGNGGGIYFYKCGLYTFNTYNRSSQFDLIDRNIIRPDYIGNSSAYDSTSYILRATLLS